MTSPEDAVGDVTTPRDQPNRPPPSRSRSSIARCSISQGQALSGGADAPSLTELARRAAEADRVGTKGSACPDRTKDPMGVNGRLSLCQGSEVRQPNREPPHGDLE